MEILKFTIEPSEFHKIKIEERAFLTVLGNLVNDIISLRKIILLLSDYKGDQINKILSVDQILSMIIIMAGKLYECRSIIGMALKDKEMGIRYDKELSSEGKKRLKRIRKMDKTPIQKIRNKLAAHYDLDKIKEVLTKHELDTYEFYMGSEWVFYRYRMLDILRGLLLLELYGSKNLNDLEKVKESLIFFQDQVIDISDDIYNYFDEVFRRMVALYDCEYQMEEVTNIEVGRFIDFNIPFFVSISGLK